MAKFWKEPLDPSRHHDHFYPGGPRPRAAGPRDVGFSYFVRVVGFTFEFASVDQIGECLSFLQTRIHPSSRAPVFAPEKGEWQAWHERLPKRVLKGSKRERVISALCDALSAFTASA